MLYDVRKKTWRMINILLLALTIADASPAQKFIAILETALILTR
jgi:hypothetical protein